MITQNSTIPLPVPGSWTFIPKIEAMSVSGRKATLNAVRTRSVSFRRWLIADSLVDSRPSMTSL
jgi:hypothetical protein